MPVEKSAGAVVFRKERGTLLYLLLHHELGHWDFPKGWIERREELLETARREIKEETGIKDIEFIPGFKENIKYFFYWQGKKIFKIVTLFLAETKTKEVKISYEHTGYKWLPHEEASKQLNHKNVKEVLKKAAVYLGCPTSPKIKGDVGHPDINKNRDPEIPCHRVIRSDGQIGGYNRGQKKKNELLKREGAL